MPGRSPAGTGWRKLSFDDSKWTLLPAPFFYGEEAEGGSEVDDMYGTATTLFLRKKFDIAAPAEIQNLVLQARCDDGFIAWINGIEVWRYNMPPGDVGPSGTALGPVSEPTKFVDRALTRPQDYLVRGRNVLAIQVFNAALRSGDLFFDVELTRPAGESTPPSIAAVSPPPGMVNSLTAVTVTFNELVIGVKASDLLMNGQPASAVSGADRTYQFHFTPASAGPALLSWNPNQAITDLAPSPNHFRGDLPGAQWVYDVGDLGALRMSAIYPPPEATVGPLTTVDITFSQEVQGVKDSDLRLNSQPALRVTGSKAGPYRFEFSPPPPGVAQVSWDASQAIRPTGFPGADRFSQRSWTYTVDPGFTGGSVIISELMAGFQDDFVDEDGENTGWVELFNAGAAPVNLEGWSLSNNPQDPAQWVFPARVLAPGQYLLVYTSAKNRRSSFSGAPLHANFRLSPRGEALTLFDASSPRQLVAEFAPAYPEQVPNYSYGFDPFGQLRYFQSPTPGKANGQSSLNQVVAPVHFNVDPGLFDVPITLVLSTATPGALIKYTTDGSEPTTSVGNIYDGPLRISDTRVIRASGFAPNAIRSAVQTRTYILNPTPAIASLPILSLASPPSGLYGANGIFGIKGGRYVPVGSPGEGVTRWQRVNPGDYHNPSKTGPAWERPVSFELLPRGGGNGVQVDAGFRVQGSDTSRLEYRQNSKFSFRAYFRARYGSRKLSYPLFGDLPVEAFDKLDLRAGHNDPVNPFITDELMRRLFGRTGQLSVHGTFVNLFLNGQYQGYYNPTERVDRDFVQAWFGGTNEWDIINPVSTVRNGDNDAWLSLTNYIASHDLTNPDSYLEVARRLDLTNFVDYLLVNIYGDTHDWTLNNWNAVREQTPGSPFRFLMRDAEFAFGIYDGSPANNSIEDSNDLGNGWEISRFFRALRRSPEFKLLFADRIQKHFFNEGALTDTNILREFEALRIEMSGVIPKMAKYITTVWIPKRRGNVMNHFAAAGFLASENAPSFNQMGGRVSSAFRLSMRANRGRIYYTTDGSDPRTLFSGGVAGSARPYDAPLAIPASMTVKARTLSNGSWSALTEAHFERPLPASPIRITELMYHPQDDEPYEFIELFNSSLVAFDLSGYSLRGINFTFPGRSIIPGGAVWVLGSGLDPARFAARYPGVTVVGTFDGNLSNSGEKISLEDPAGRPLFSVTYDDENGWPDSPDGGGPSLEIISSEGGPNDPANWQSSQNNGGSPGFIEPPATYGSVLLNEVMALAAPGSSPPGSWVELYNAGHDPVDLGGWILAHDGPGPPLIFPEITLRPGEYQVILCDADFDANGLHSGFNLDLRNGALFLLAPGGARIDAISYGWQAAGFSIGRTGPAQPWQLTVPTPGRVNVPAITGNPSSLRLNEWLANPLPGGKDWIELFNQDFTLPVALAGLILRTSNEVASVKSLAFVGPRDYIQLVADRSAGPNEIELRLASEGDALELSTSGGELIDQVVFGPLAEGTSQGRVPDGGSQVAIFERSGTPGAPNVPAAYGGPSVNEVLVRAQAAAGGVDWIELWNPSGVAAPMNGMALEIGATVKTLWHFPDGTQIPGNGYLIVWCDPRRAPSVGPGADLNLGASLPDDWGSIDLWNAAGQVVQRLEYGGQVPNQSIGQSGGAWRLLSALSPGGPNAPPAALGPAGSLRINEWMAKSAEAEEWFELFNLSSLPVDLSGLFLTDDPSLAGKSKFVIPPLSFIPGKGWLTWKGKEKDRTESNEVNFNLDAEGDSLWIFNRDGKPIDQVAFGPQSVGVSQGRLPDGDGPGVILGFATPGSANNLPPVLETPSEVPSQPPKELRFQSVELFTDSQTLVFRFAAEPGATYSLLSGGPALESSWEKEAEFGPLPSAGEGTFTRPVPAQPARFYRLVSPAIR